MKQEIVSALLYVGHDADGQVSSNEIYDALPACCKYRSLALKKHPEGTSQKSKSLS